MNIGQDRETRYAVIWANTSNIGDDIQTIAAINFLKNKGITEHTFINREKLSDYDGHPITLVMNGWFTHNNVNKFLPSEKITPIFISFHVAKEILVKRYKSYFKKHEPIGCRDQNTVRIFEKYNIKAYFVGCLTLTLGTLNAKDGDRIKKGKYLVDVDYGFGITKSQKKTIYKDYTAVNHNAFFGLKRESIQKRIKDAHIFLERYRNAEIVITTRLHCALPCRALGTKVIFVHKNYHNDSRFTGLRSILNGGNAIHNNEDYDKNKHNSIIKFFDEYKI